MGSEHSHCKYINLWMVQESRGPWSPQPPHRSCCCRGPDLTSRTFFPSPFSLSSFSTLFFLLTFSFLHSFTSIPTNSPSLLFYLHFSLPALPLSPPGPALLSDYQEAHGPVNHPEETAEEGPSSLHHPGGGGVRCAPHVLELC